MLAALMHCFAAAALLTALAAANACLPAQPSVVTGVSAAEAPRFGRGFLAVSPTPQAMRQELAMARRLNRDRTQRGLAPLTLDQRLSDVARSHCADMISGGFFAHESPSTGSVGDRLEAAGYAHIRARENLSEAPTVAISQDDLLRSPHHRENILATDVTHVGIGIVAGGVNDARSITVTQVFAEPVRVESIEQAREHVVARLGATRAQLALKPIRSNKRLQQLALRHLETLDASPSAEALGKLGATVRAETRGLSFGPLQVSVQQTPDSTRAYIPELISDLRECYLGVAARRVTDERGQPILQLLMIVAGPRP